MWHFFTCNSRQFVFPHKDKCGLNQRFALPVRKGTTSGVCVTYHNGCFNALNVKNDYTHRIRHGRRHGQVPNTAIHSIFSMYFQILRIYPEICTNHGKTKCMLSLVQYVWFVLACLQDFTILSEISLNHNYTYGMVQDKNDVWWVLMTTWSLLRNKEKKSKW